MTEQINANTTQAQNTGQNLSTGQQRFTVALARGKGGLLEQIQSVLLLSQLHGAKSTTAPYPEKPLTIRQARLRALLVTMDDLSQEQVRVLLRDVIQIGDASLRLPMLLRFAIKLPPANYRGVVRDVWKQQRAVVDPVARARILYGLAPFLLLMGDEPAASTPLLDVLAVAQAIKSTESRIRSLIVLAPHLPENLSRQIFQRVLDELIQSQNDSLVSKSLMTLAPHLSHQLTDAVLKVVQSIRKPSERARALTALARHMNAEKDSRMHEQALNAIDAIDDEGDRADALVAFAPNLEYAQADSDYPVLLEKALTTAILFTRRQLRARVLVALAPHLTVDLQGEALATVHNLESERERANLLSQLAPNLPSDMLVASLVVAHHMRERDSRVQALTALAQYVPEHTQAQTTKDALAAASNLPNLYERVQALVDMMTMLPEKLSEQALRTALLTTRQIDNANARTRALSLLGDKLLPSMYGDALKIAYTLDNPEHQINALLSMVKYIPDEDKPPVYDTLLQSAARLPIEYKQARALISIAPHIPHEKLPEAEALAEKVLTDPIDLFNVYVTIAQHLPPEARVAVIQKAQIKLNRMEDGYDRASAMAAIIPYLPDNQRETLPKKALDIIHSIQDEYDKASAIGLLSPLLSDDTGVTASDLPDNMTALRRGIDAALSVPQQQLRAELLAEGVRLWLETADADRTFVLWKHIAATLTTLPVADVLLCLGVMMPLFRQMGGDTTIKRIAYLLGIR